MVEEGDKAICACLIDFRSGEDSLPEEEPWCWVEGDHRVGMSALLEEKRKEFLLLLQHPFQDHRLSLLGGGGLSTVGWGTKTNSQPNHIEVFRSLPP